MPIVGLLILLSSMMPSISFAADYGVFEIPAKMKGDTLICEASPRQFGWVDLVKAFELKRAEGFHAVTGYWQNYEQQKVRDVPLVYCIRVRPNNPS